MGYRALVLYEDDPRTSPALTGPSIDTPTADTPDEYRVALHSQNGALDLRLVDDITVGSPFGQKNPPEAVIGQAMSEHITAETDADAGYAFDDAEPRDVDPNSELGEHLTVEEAVTDLLDFSHYDAFYIVHDDHSVDAYRALSTVFPAGLLPDAETASGVGEGVLFAPSKPSEDAYVRVESWYDGLRAATASRVRAGELSREEGQAYLRQALLGRLDFESDVKLPRFSPYHTDNVEPAYEFAPGEGLEDVELWGSNFEGESTGEDDDGQRTMGDF